jgi:hypothetical protein
MPCCTIQIVRYNLTHRCHNSFQYNPTTSPNIATPWTTSLPWQIIQPPLQPNCRTHSASLNVPVLPSQRFLSHHPIYSPCIPIYHWIFLGRDNIYSSYYSYQWGIIIFGLFNLATFTWQGLIRYRYKQEWLHSAHHHAYLCHRILIFWTISSG